MVSSDNHPFLSDFQTPANLRVRDYSLSPNFLHSKTIRDAVEELEIQEFICLVTTYPVNTVNVIPIQPRNALVTSRAAGESLLRTEPEESVAR